MKFFFSLVIQKVPECQLVAFQTKAGNYPYTVLASKADVSEFLPRIDIGNMHFHNRRFDGRNGIRYGYRGMGIPSAIQNDPLIIKPAFM